MPKMRTVSSAENDPSVRVVRSSAREMRPSLSASCSSSFCSSRWIGFCMSLWRWRTFSFSAYSRAASVSGRAGGSAPGASQLRVMSVSSPANRVKPSVRVFAGLNRADRGYCADAWSSGWSRRRNESRGSMESHHPSNTWVGLLQRSPPSTYSSAFASPVTRSYTERRLTGWRRTGSDIDMRVATRTAMFGVVLM